MVRVQDLAPPPPPPLFKTLPPTSHKLRVFKHLAPPTSSGTCIQDLAPPPTSSGTCIQDLAPPPPPTSSGTCIQDLRVFKTPPPPSPFNLILHVVSLVRLLCGVIARSAGLFQNSKRLCTCDGVSIWDEAQRKS